MSLMSVDLPHPFGPRMATCSPWEMERVMESSATRSSRRTDMLSSSMRGINQILYGCRRGLREIGSGPFNAEEPQCTNISLSFLCACSASLRLCVEDALFLLCDLSRHLSYSALSSTSPSAARSVTCSAGIPLACVEQLKHGS